MSSEDQELTELKLKRLRPAALPEDFLGRLNAARAKVARSTQTPDAPAGVSGFWPWLKRGLTPIAAAAAVVLAVAVWFVIWRLHTPVEHAEKQSATVPAPPLLKADNVVIDRQLIATYEAVANLPSGEPVRLQYREWIDDVLLRDTARGIEIQQRTPRFEIVPVRFETY